MQEVVTYTPEQLRQLTWKWWAEAKRTQDPVTRQVLRRCADELTELLDPAQSPNL